MLKLNLIKPRDALNKQLSKKSIVKNDLEQFKSSLNKLMSVNAAESEEHQKNEIKEFLASSFGYKINTKGRIDYAIYDGLDVKVIIEAKRLDNKAEMITPNEANRKAMHEAILYFMQERKSGNDKLCRIVIANAFDWFVFDAVDFERLFWQNKSFKNRFLDFDNGKLLRKDTPYFYDEIAKPFLDSMKKDLVNDEEIECIYLDLRGEKNEKELNAVYKLLSSDHLLKEFNPNDANSLNKAFYNEFLYILGLEESKEGGKKLIQRAKTPQNGTLYENIRQKLEHQDKHSDFETIVSVLIVWINRILFLKLLESQIYRFNGNDKSYKFLNSKKIGDFDALESLFFEILAKPVKNRNTKEFDYVPYLNSSLFEYHELEKKYISISNLRDSLSIKYYAQTVLKEGSTKKSGDIDTLTYLFEFLDAYNFASDGAEEVIEDNKTLINASVLGLIFEKLNGYKDGSFYTPSFITMYMAKEAIQKAVFGKFELAHGIKADTIEALNAELIRRKISIGETKKLIDSVTLCDPAVGSGHFLVSALNELIYIKYSLGLFGFRHLSIDIESDELFVRMDGEFHEYKKPKDMETDNHKLQKMLFEEKRLIIENQLFGVDINPNSVNITRLRLWIELLKHTYYHADGTLETLPNIDINIKCGNSLISRFDLSDSLKIKNIKHEIEHYKRVVGDYKENLGSKKDVLKSIENLKDKFRLTLKAEWKVGETRNAKLKEFVSEYGTDTLDDTLMLIAMKNRYGQTASLFGDEPDQKKKAKLLAELGKLQAQIDEIESGKIYENAFEWRFEFPEVLDEKGDFVGFDVVIGNPPYFNIDTYGAGSPMLGYLPQNYPDVYMDKSDILFYFIARAIEISKGQVAYIISNAMLGADKARKLRNHILDNAPIEKIINFEKYQVFDEANITSMMIFMDKKHTGNAKVQNFTQSVYDKNLLLTQVSQESEYIDVEFAKNENFALVDEVTTKLNQKIDSEYPKLGELFHVGSGMQTAANDVFGFEKYPVQFEATYIKSRMSGGEIIEKYSHKEPFEYLLYFENVEKFDDLPKNIRDYLSQDENKKKLEDRATVKNEGRAWWRYSRPMHKEFYYLPKIWCSYRAKENIFCLDESRDFIGLTNTTAIFGNNPNIDLKYVLALLNSKLLNFRYKSIGKQTGSGVYEYFENQISKFPIPEIDTKAQKPFIDLVDKILNLKKSGGNTSELEKEMDDMVYELYNLTEDEIATVEGAK